MTIGPYRTDARPWFSSVRRVDHLGMTKSLDVLLIESQPGDGAVQTERLQAAGHRVHCCFTPADHGEHAAPGRVPLRERYLCLGVTDHSCPLERGIDVALLVRGRVKTEPTAREAGATCALRAGVPLVEAGPEMLDPFAAWLTACAGDDIVMACEETAELGFQPLRDEIMLRISRVLAGAGIDRNDVDVLFDFASTRLTVRLRGPAVGGSVEQALGVRVLDALRTSRRKFRSSRRRI